MVNQGLSSPLNSIAERENDLLADISGIHF